MNLKRKFTMILMVVLMISIPSLQLSNYDEASTLPQQSTFLYDTLDGNVDVNIDIEEKLETNITFPYQTGNLDINTPNWNTHHVDINIDNVNKTSSDTDNRGQPQFIFNNTISYDGKVDVISSMFNYESDVYIDEFELYIDSYDAYSDVGGLKNWFSTIKIGIQTDISSKPSGIYLSSIIMNETKMNNTGNSLYNWLDTNFIDSDMIFINDTILHCPMNIELNANQNYWIVVETTDNGGSGPDYVSIAFGFGYDIDSNDFKSIDGGTSWESIDGDLYSTIKYRKLNIDPTTENIAFNGNYVDSDGKLTLMGLSGNTNTLIISSDSSIEYNANVIAYCSVSHAITSMDYSITDDTQVDWSALAAVSETPEFGDVISHTYTINGLNGWSTEYLDGTSPFDLIAQSSDIITAMTINDNNVTEGTALTGSFTATQITTCDVKLLDSSDNIVASDNGIGTETQFSLDTTGLSEGYYKIYAIAEDGANGWIGFEENNTWVYVSESEEPITTVDLGDAELEFTFTNGDKIDNLEWVRIENSTWDNTYYPDTNGNFTITDLEYGTYNLIIRYDGQTYLLEDVTITIDDDVVYATLNSGIDAPTTDGTTDGTDSGDDPNVVPEIDGFPLWIVGIISMNMIVLLMKRKK